jgi:hypothetical protein
MPSDVRAAMVSLATISPGTRGFITAFPCGLGVPGTSSLNFDADDPIAAVSVSATGGGSLCVFSNSRAHLIVDLLGVWVPTPDAPPPTEGPPPPSEDPEDMDPPVAPGDDAGVVLPSEDAAVPSGIDASPTTPRADAGSSVSQLGGTCSCRVASARSRPSAHVAFVLMLAAVQITRMRRRTKRARRA